MFLRAVRKIFGQTGQQRALKSKFRTLAVEMLEERVVPTAEFNGPLPDWINVQTSSQLTLHAKGNGTTDDTAALQAALNYVYANPYTTTGNIYLPAGTYVVSSTLWLWGSQGVTITGANPSTTTIEWEGTSGGSLFHINGSRSFSMNRLTLNGNNTAGDLLWLDWNTSISQPPAVNGAAGGLEYGGPNQIADVYFENALIGIQAASGTDTAVAETSVERCQFDNTANGIFLDSGNALDWWIENCTFVNNVTAVGTEETPSLNQSTWTQGGGGFQLMNCVFEDSTESDIIVSNVGGPVVIQSCFSVDSDQFIVGYSSKLNGFDLSVEDTTVLDPTSGSAIYFQNFTPLTLIDNKFRTTSYPIFFNEGIQYGVGQVPAGQLLAIGNEYSQPAGSVYEGALWQLVAIEEDPGANLSGISSTPPAPAAPLPLETRPIVQVTAYTSAAIQTAINTAVADYPGQSPIVYLPAGSYSVASTIEVPANSDVQIVGDGSWVTHASELVWYGPSGGTMIELQGPSQAVLKDFNLVGVPNGGTIDAGTLIQVDNADQPGSQVFADTYTNDGANTGPGVFSDGLNYTNVDLVNSGPSGVEVTGNPAGSASGLATGSTILENGGGDQNSADDEEYSVSNGGNLYMTGLWWEGPVTNPIFNLSGTGNISVLGMHLGYYAQSTNSNEIALNNFTGNASFLNIDSENNNLGSASTTGVLAAGSAPTQLLFADSDTATTAPIVNNLTNASGNAVSLNTIDWLANVGADVNDEDQGFYTAAWVQQMLSSVIHFQPLQEPSTSGVSGVTDVQLYGVATWSAGTYGLHIEGSQSGLFTANTDIGSPSPAGSSTLSGTTYTVMGGGTGIGEIQYDYQPYSGNGTIIAKVASITDTNAGRHGGSDGTRLHCIWCGFRRCRGNSQRWCLL